jgi:hypothetical protein
MRLNKIAKKAGINKRIHPHLFRHSRATYMANFLTEAQMNAYFGWVQGSSMPSIYVHLPGCDIDDAVLKANGIVQKDVSTPTVQKETEDYHYMTIILWKMRDTTKRKQYKGNR